MSDYSISNFLSSSYVDTSSYNYNSSYYATTDGSTLDMTDFYQLLTAQLVNQDPLEPTSNTEFLAQMAQFSTLQEMSDMTDAINVMTELQYASYGASMIGKNVILASWDDSGELVETTGKVDNVIFLSGLVYVEVNGEVYDLGSIMELVAELPEVDADLEVDGTEVDGTVVEGTTETDTDTDTEVETEPEISIDTEVDAEV